VGRTSWGRVVLVYGAGVPAAIALGKIGLVAPLIQPDLGLSLPQVGWAVSVITAVAALFGTPMGLWTQRYGARRALLAGLAVMAVGGGAGAVAGGLGVLLAARVVEGVGYLLVVIAGPVLLVRLTAEADRAAALALWGSVIPVGLALGAAVGGPLAQTIGWRGWLGLVGAVPVLVTLLVAVAIPPENAAGPATAEPPPPTQLRLAGLGGPVLLAGGFCGLCLIGIAVVSLLPTFLVDQRGTGLGTAGAATGVVSLASVPGSLLASWLLRRGAGLRLLSATVLLVPLAALPAFSRGGSLGIGIAAACVMMVANGLAVGGVFAAVPELVPDPSQVALAIGLVTQLGSLGTLLGPPLFTGVVAATDWPAVAPLMLAWALVSLVLLLTASAWRRRVPRTVPGPPPG
jgi:predicted MFS family arabinose efflux permease